jgi:hypothetical protein
MRQIAAPTGIWEHVILEERSLRDRRSGPAAEECSPKEPGETSLMRVCVTERHDALLADLRPAVELAPNLALPWVARLRYGILGGEVAFVLLAVLVFRVDLPIAWLAIPLLATAASNLLLDRFMEAFGPRPVLGSIFALDTLCLTALLALSGGSLCQLDLAHFDTFIWPPLWDQKIPMPLSAFGGPGRSEALRRVVCGALRAKRRPGLPKARDQNIGCGTLPSGSNM